MLPQRSIFARSPGITLIHELIERGHGIPDQEAQALGGIELVALTRGDVLERCNDPPVQHHVAGHRRRRERQDGNRHSKGHPGAKGRAFPDGVQHVVSPLCWWLQRATGRRWWLAGLRLRPRRVRAIGFVNGEGKGNRPRGRAAHSRGERDRCRSRRPLPSGRCALAEGGRDPIGTPTLSPSASAPASRPSPPGSARRCPAACRPPAGTSARAARDDGSGASGSRPTVCRGRPAVGR